MPTIRNVSPVGDLDVPLLRRVVKAGEELVVTDDQADRLLAQEENFVTVSRRAAKSKEGGE